MSKFLTAPDLKILASLIVHDSLHAIAAELNLTPSKVQVTIERTLKVARVKSFVRLGRSGMDEKYCFTL